ncbi:MAG: chemotaxis-specific protein-glutamate methyltransferase CheB [Myxococcaceae bacterium]
MAGVPPRVLVIDDSAFVRKVVRECLTAAGIEVVGVARDGLEALEMIAELAPDVITLDLVMPNLDGLGVLNALAGKPAPRVVVVSTCEDDSLLGVEALQEGGFDVVRKPTALAINQLYEIGDPLVAAVRAAALAIPRTRANAAPVPAKLPALGTTRELLVVGASTGGPQALTRMVSMLPANFPVPIAVVLHIPQGYTAALAKRLDDTSALEVVEAAEGGVLQAGRVVIARAGHHLKLAREGGLLRCRLDLLPLESQHRPSVDVLFESAAQVVGAATLGVVLTGMGGDGLLGARAIHAVGGSILTEAASSCVVYGMPRVVVEAGLSAGEAPIERMVDEIIRFL